MSNEANRHYLTIIRKRYHNAFRAGKEVVLDEFCAISEYNREYVMKALNPPLKPKLPKKGRP